MRIMTRESMSGLQEMAGGNIARRAPRGRKMKSRRRKMAVVRLEGSVVRPRRRFLGTAALYRRRLPAACASDAVQRVLEGAALALVGAVRLDAGV